LIFLHDLINLSLESHVSCQESNQQLCNRIETKLSQLNQIGLILKKENHGLLIKFQFIFQMLFKKLKHIFLLFPFRSDSIAFAKRNIYSKIGSRVCEICLFSFKNAFFSIKINNLIQNKQKKKSNIIAQFPSYFDLYLKIFSFLFYYVYHLKISIVIFNKS
jgi:hypothetical protein